MEPSEVLHKELDKRWKSTCRILFGREVGELSEFDEWLSKGRRQTYNTTSSISRKPVSLMFSYYPPDSRKVSLDEVNLEKQFPPLSINEIKDIDSIIEAVRERVEYTGNMHLGNSKFIEESTDIIECFYVYCSAQITYSKYVAHGYCMEYADSVFGSMNHGNCSQSARFANADFLRRCFEVYTAEECSGCYYSHNIYNSRDCMFCFNVRSMSQAIGNLKLSRDKYAAVKAKLVAEMAEELGKEKRLPDLMEIAGNSLPDPRIIEHARQWFKKKPKDPTTIAPMERAFSNTTRVVLGTDTVKLDECGKWLAEFTRSSTPGKSALSGEGLQIVDYAFYSLLPKNRLVDEEEAMHLGNILTAHPSQVDGLSFSNAGEMLEGLAFFRLGIDYGELANLPGCQVNISSTNCYKNFLNIYTKNSAYNYYTHESDSVFGCDGVRKSSFLIRCYLSAKLSRCLEVDSSRDCTDTYFSHNCENVKNSMFCFNVKNRRNAIGNAPLQPDAYQKIKTAVVEQLRDEFEKNKELKLSIFNLLERGK
ncbi:MAG: hypothetical protein ABIG39_07895 [Candidatus Micrarchaeota archaeon]